MNIHHSYDADKIKRMEAKNKAQEEYLKKYHPQSLFSSLSSWWFEEKKEEKEEEYKEYKH